MSLVPTYIYEEGTELPDNGTYFVVAANGMFMHKDAGIVKALVRFNLDKVPLLRDFIPPKPKSLPIYVYDNECDELPEDGNYFVVAKNGVHLHGKNPKFVQSQFEDIPNLGILQPKVRFDLPEIPVEIIWQCLLFFRRVWYVYKAEAAVILFYNEQTKKYCLHCPKQQVTCASVRYGTVNGQPDPDEIIFINEMRQKNFSRIGTIHSHCNFSAYHSGVDTHDEADWPDGVHITIGNVDMINFSVASSLVVNDNRFQVDPATIINGLQANGSLFDVALTIDEREVLVGLHQQEIENEWMPKVSTFYKQPNYFSVEKENKGGFIPKKIRHFLRKVRNYGVALRFNHHGDKAKMIAVLKKFFRKDDITHEHIVEASLVNPKLPADYEKKGYSIE